MDVLFHSYYNILKLPVNFLLGIDINLNQLETNLKEINQKLQKQSHSEGLQIQMVKNEVMDMNDLINYLCRKERTGVLKVNDRFKAFQLQKSINKLELLLNDKKAEPAEAANKGDRMKSEYDTIEKSTNSVVFGRENEKKKIVDQLLKVNNSDVVIVIVGVPGIGKTTLARLVCEDEQVKANFGQIWINLLHETFDVESIAKRVTTTYGKRLLLVIDDLPVEIEHDDIENLQKKLKEVVGGRTDTAILISITTRSRTLVVNKIAAGHVFELQELSEEESLSLFLQLVGATVTSTKKEQSTAEPEHNFKPELNPKLESKLKPEPELEIVNDCTESEPELNPEPKTKHEPELEIVNDCPESEPELNPEPKSKLKPKLEIVEDCTISEPEPEIVNDCTESELNPEPKSKLKPKPKPELEIVNDCTKPELNPEPKSKLKHKPKLEIVEDCSGVPLLISIKANLVKNRSIGGPSILQEVAATTLTEEDMEMKLQELKLHYYGKLPTHLQLCFSYISLFAEDYLIDAERLIQLWSAEGFLTIPQQQCGRAFFDNFVPMVFQQVEEENKYRMNPLMHKLAKLVATDFDKNIIVDSMGERVRSGMLRALFDYPIDLLCGIPDSMFENAKQLRTILLPYNTNNPRLPHEARMTTSTCDKIFNTFISLHVLDMHDLGIKTVPGSIEKVKYLKYLDLSKNNIVKLPSCITKLVHLQTLKLSQCHVLKELPKDIDDLSFLNHLDIEGCLDLTHMPTRINKITSLQTLSLFVASKKQVMGGLRALTDLNNLRGHMEISHLEQVKLSPSTEAAKDGFLKNKEHLELLTLRWEHNEKKKKKENTVNRDKDKKLLEYLEPHENLKVLFVVGYNGHTLPNWFGSLKCLVKFTLNNCPKCQFLPPLDHLQHLKVLQLRRLDSLQFIAKNKEVDSSSSAPILFFQSLKELTISDCPNLESWWENDEIPVIDRPYFGCISKINVHYCPKLACLPLYPGLDEELVLVESILHQHPKNETTSSEAIIPFSKLKSMVIEGIDYSPPEDWIGNFTSLQKLHIRDCINLKSLPQGFKSLSLLRTLTIEKCQQLDLDISEDEWKGLKSLHSLTLRTIPKLKSLPQGLENVNSLKELRLYDCSGLTSLAENIVNLTSLGKLVISECRSLESLPKGMKNMKSLHTLIIMDCPFLLPRCQPHTGDDWPQIAHIKNILVKQNFS